ncbi:MAG: amidohydrolase/deacetylase family metallohydrolase [Flavitalea sp.]
MKNKNRIQVRVPEHRTWNNKMQHLPVLLMLGLCLSVIPRLVQGQEIDLLLKGGHVIDPKNNIDAVMDVAIVQGKIFKVAPNIEAKTAKKVVEVKNMFVTPGLIDLHTHVFAGSSKGFAGGTSSVMPDDFTLRAGITTVVDAGDAGWRNFPAFKEQIIDSSKTRVLVFLNAFGQGMKGEPGGEDVNDMDSEKMSEINKTYPGYIVGICIGHYRGGDWAVFEKATSAAKAMDMPVFVECHLKGLSLEGQLDRMRSGDILTHCFEKVKERTPVMDDQGKVQPYVLKARDRGILFDVGHGGAGFWFSQAVPAMKAGFLPNSFGTDMHHNSVNGGMKDMLNVMSKFLNMGMSLKDILLRASWSPARSIKREDLGNLSEGAVADIAVLEILKGKFGFVDAGNNSIEGDKKLEAELTIRAGKIVWDLNGISAEKFHQ